MVKFSVKAKLLADALKRVRAFLRDIPGSNPTLYVAACAGGSALWARNSMASADEGPRLVIGAAGFGHDHRFVDVPLETLQSEGRFLYARMDQLLAWATKLGNQTATIAYVPAEFGGHFELTHPRGTKSLPSYGVFDDAYIDTRFLAASDRFDELTETIPAAASTFFTTAAGLAVAGPGRAGDLTVSPDRFVFESYRADADYATSATLIHPEGIGFDVEWEVTRAHLLALETAASSDRAFIGFGGEDGARLAQISYSVAVGRGRTPQVVYVEDQITVRRELEPVRRWAVELADDTPLWASVDSRQFFDSLTLLGTLTETYDAEISRVREDGRLLISSGTDDADRVDAVSGPAETETLVVSASIIERLTAVVASAERFQIRTVVGEDGEQDNNMIVVPVPDDHPANEPYDDPAANYILVQWGN